MSMLYHNYIWAEIKMGIFELNTLFYWPIHIYNSLTR